MTLKELLELLQDAPIVPSVQASKGSPLNDTRLLLKIAEASCLTGSKIVRLEGVETISLIQKYLKVPVIGLIKKHIEDIDPYITPSNAEVEALIKAGCEVIALDGTNRRRPNGEHLKDLIHSIHSAGKLALADCDCPENVRFAIDSGADLISTTLAGYTSKSNNSVRTNDQNATGPDLEFLRWCVKNSSVPVLAEGRYSEPWQARAAIQIGAAGVVIGGALNDPVRQTKRFLQAVQANKGLVGAVDIGGTWLRFGVFSSDWKLLFSERIRTPANPRERLKWIIAQITNADIEKLGLGSGGTLDPITGQVIESKELIPNYVGTRWSNLTLGVPTIALNDGLATAWGHSCLQQFAGKRIATLAIGTGLGFGMVEKGSLLLGPHGEYPRLNDLKSSFGLSYEQILGGGYKFENVQDKKLAIQELLEVIQKLYLPQEIVLCGAVGLKLDINIDVHRSPFDQDAGLYGAAALILYPPFHNELNATVFS